MRRQGQEATKIASALVTRLEKAAVDNGFDRELPRDADWLAYASTQAPLRIWLTAADDGTLLAALSMGRVAAALGDYGTQPDIPLPSDAAGARRVASIADLHLLVRRAFQLSRTLPDELLLAFNRRVAGLPRATEVERLVVERVGQEVFRAGLLEY